MIMKANKQIGFIYKNDESIDKILKDGEVVFERGFLREKTSTTLPITFGGIGKDLKDYKIDGNTYQNSTTGKNLLNYIDTFVSSGGGLTNIINDDGSITTTGIPTSNYRPIVSQYDIIDDLEDGQTYTISSETLNQFLYIQINAVKIAGGTDYIYNNSTRTQTFTVDKSKYNAYNIKIQTSTTSGWGSNNRTITNKYQLEKGATATEFEPYTGGQPSPNPDYPQEIISCGDRTRNLFDKMFTSGYHLASNGKPTEYQNDSRCATLEPIDVSDVDAVTFSFTNTLRTDAKKYMYAIFDGSTLITRVSNQESGNVIDVSQGNKLYLCVYSSLSSVNAAETTTNVMLNSGSTVIPYEPYGYKIPVNVRSENLFDKDNANILNAYLSEQKVISSNSARCLYIRCEPNTTYTVHKRQGNRFAVAYSEETPTINSSARITQDNTASNITITTNNTANYLIVWYYSGTYDTTISEEQMRESVIIIEGSTAPSKYIQYYNQTTNIYLDEPLRKSLNNIYTDYIDFANQKIIRRNGISVINVDDITLKSNYTNVEYASSPKPSDFIGYNSYSAQPTFCSHATYLFNPSNYDTKNNVGRFITGPERGNWWIGFPKGTGLTEIKSKLDGCEFVYILATPTEETITLPSIPTIDGNNTLNIETEITPSQVYIKYKSNE